MSHGKCNKCSRKDCKCDTNAVIASTSKADAPVLCDMFNTIYVLVNCVKNPSVTTNTIAQLLAVYNGLITIPTAQAIVNLPLGAILAGFFSLSQSNVTPTTVIQKFDFGDISYFIKLADKPANKINVLVPFIEIIQNMAKTITDDLGFATAFIKLNILAGRQVVDTNTGKTIKVDETVSKLILSPVGLPQRIDEVELSLKCNTVPLTLQLFVFKTDNLANLTTAGHFVIGLVLVTDFTGLTTTYNLVINGADGEIIAQYGTASFDATFVPYVCGKCDYWVLEYAPPIASANLDIFADSLALIPPVPAITQIIRQAGLITVIGTFGDITGASVGGVPVRIVSADSSTVVLASEGTGPVILNTTTGSATLSDSAPTISEIIPNMGPGGMFLAFPSLESYGGPPQAVPNTISIIGTNLASVTSVQANDVSIPFKILPGNGTQIIASMPSYVAGDPISFPITVVSPSGSASHDWAYSVTLSSFSPSNVTVGTNITINGSGFKDGGSVIFTVEIGSGNHIQAIPTPNNDTSFVIVADGNFQIRSMQIITPFGFSNVLSTGGFGQS